MIAELRRRLDALEKTYGIPSEHVRQAVRDGRLEDTHETCTWVILWESYVAATRVEPARLE
ncbi:MAG TPA: hypothetical protein VNO86_01900 [Candidatus Binatia bacterium]|nr:hypothetical protein [Candidatus Binatia bacterium]